MKSFKSLVLFALLVSSNLAFAQSFNPFTQNIEFNPEPTPLGYVCGETPIVEFTQGLTTSTDAPLVVGDELTVTICITGFEWNGTTVGAVVGGSYSSNFNWAFDPFAPNCITGTQNTTLPGTGTNPIFPNPLAAGQITLALYVDSTLAQGTVLAVNVNLQPSAYMNSTNSAPDDDESTQTQSAVCPTGFNIPLEVLSFEAKELNCDVLLNWETAQEENTSHVSVLRKDGEFFPYKEIARVELAGWNESNLEYSFLDQNVENQMEAYQYQLKFYDLDGTFSRSEVKSVQMNCGGPTAGEVRLFPNPANNQINFVYSSQEGDIQLFVRIMDATGRIIREKEMIIEDTRGIMTFNLDDIAAGQYLIQYENVEEGIQGALKFAKK